MEPLIDQLNAVIPPKYQPWLVLAYFVSTQITRAAQALMTGRGLRGTFAAVWLGTNTPTPAKDSKPEA